MKFIKLLIVCLFFNQSLFGAHRDFKIVKKEIMKIFSKIEGSCSHEKAWLMMDLIKRNQFETCVEIGVLNGRSLLPIIETLKFKKKGKVIAIDCWNFEESYKNFIAMIQNRGLTPFLEVIKAPSELAYKQFKDQSIDFIHIDGDHLEASLIKDVLNYFPKVKDSGYILINISNWFETRQAVVYLLERSDLISPFERSSSYLLFKKNKKKMKNLKRIMINP